MSLKGNEVDPKMADLRFRNACFTAWKKPTMTDEKLTYWVWGEEICPETKKIHWQGFCQFSGTVGLNRIKKAIGDNSAHVEKMRGTPKEASDYCKKDGKFEEWGEIRNQGQRADLDKLKDEILAGKKVDDLTLENPTAYHQYGRTMNRVEDIAMRRKYRTEMTEGVWITGDTGVGKSHKAFEGFTPETHYVVNSNDRGWWDGYTQQETVIINDFRGHIPYSELLQMIDKWPYSVPRRGREPIPFTSKKVIITSVLRPEEVYLNVNSRDGIDQLLRRLKVETLKSGTRNEVV